ncbi:hypothetical protein LCGC14_2507400, partial [marine sediment metagenome]
MIDVGEGQNKNYELLFRSIYMDSPIGIEIYDSNGKLLDLNKSCMELFGILKKDDIRGFDLLKDPNIPNEQITRLKRGETVKFESYFDFEIVRTHKLYDTSKTGNIYLGVTITPLFLGDDNSISNYLVQIQDISDRKKNDQKLRLFNFKTENQISREIYDSEKKLKNLIEAIPIGITITSFDDRIFDCNSQAVKMLGYDSKEEFLEISALDLYSNPNDRIKFLELHRGGLVKDFDVLAKRKDGST